MRVLAILLSLGLLCSGSAFAEELRKETAHEYLELMGVEENVRATFEVMLDPLLDAVLKGVAQSALKRGIAQEKTKSAVDAMRPYLTSVKNELLLNIHVLMPMPELEEQVYLPVLRESFNDEELTEINAFLMSPIGQKYARESMTVFRKSAQLSQAIYGPKIEQFFASEMLKRREHMIRDVTAALEK